MAYLFLAIAKFARMMCNCVSICFSFFEVDNYITLLFLSISIRVEKNPNQRSIPSCFFLAIFILLLWGAWGPSRLVFHAMMTYLFLLIILFSFHCIGISRL
uniref:Uncharacterized protein n=1 Tax=Opuntia streptacantha TaxID=393608 RepID=A0A7C9DFR0_OPUST